MSANDLDIAERLKPKIKLVLEYNGKEVLNERLYRLLVLINKKGSIYSASRSLGVPYSRAWEWITKLERDLKGEVIVKMRGGSRGGGARLTDLGKELIRIYHSKLLELKLDLSTEDIIGGVIKVPDLLYVGSHDPLIEIILSAYAKKHDLSIEFARVGSCSGLLAIMLEEADVTAIHLMDPETGEYNLPYLDRYGLKGSVIVVRGYEREVCLAHHPLVKIDSIRDAVLGGYRIVNRNIGSGTRILLDYFLDKIASELGVEREKIKKNLAGYYHEVRDHYEVAKLISGGKADFALLPRTIAMNYGLSCVPLIWERYDIVIPKRKFRGIKLRKLVDFLKSDSVKEIIRNTRGYRFGDDLGEVIWDS